MISFLLFLFVVAVVVDGLSQQYVQSQILSKLNSFQFEEWGFVASIWNVSTGQFDTLVQFNANQHFVPASVTKLLASSAILQTAGKSFQFNTTMRQLSNTLCIDANGDPSISYDDIVTAAKSLTPSSSQISHVSFTDAFRNLPLFPDSWEIGDAVEYYGAAPSALILNENTVSLTVSGGANDGVPAKLTLANALDGALLPEEFQNNVVTDSTSNANGADVSAAAVPFERGVVLSGALRPGDSVNLTVAVPRPNRRFAQAIGAALGLFKDEPTRVRSCAGPATQETSIVSDTLDNLIAHTLMVSDNLYAEMFLRYFARNAPNLGVALKAVLASLPPSVTAGVGRYVDGSGLSRYNAISPAAFEALMRQVTQAWPASDAAAFIQALPVAGQSGTLKHRFIGTPAQSCTHAKTGSMTGVNSLVGLISRPSATASLVTFAILVNNAARDVKPDMDTMVNLMAQLD
jgi:D-alanyl-D-alanine carboxypeptidase/D-alanyl-D-alanine-endopeptidase (penicillin-binding protein 4)